MKQQAERRRLSVSHLIRNVLEDAFDLVGGVMDHVDVLVTDSRELGRRARRDARDIARPNAPREDERAPAPEREDVDRTGADGQDIDSGEPGVREDTERAAASHKPSEPPPPRRSLDHILAWNSVTLNRTVRCSGCDTVIEKGEPGHLGVADAPGLPPEWLCGECMDAL